MSLILAVQDNLMLVDENSMAALQDTLKAISMDVKEIAKNSNPEPYTVQSLDLSRWNFVVSLLAALFGLFGAVFGLFGAVFGYFSYKYSKLTAKNVARISPDTQIALCLDFILDLYHHSVWLLVFLKGMEGKQLPDPGKLLTLRLAGFDDIFHLDAYNQDKTTFLYMKYVKDRIRDYDDDLTLCFEHLEKKCLVTSELMWLLTKPVRIILSVTQMMEGLESSSERAIDIFGFLLEKHLKHITNNADYLEKIGQGMIDDFRKVILEQNQFVFFIERIVNKQMGKSSLWHSYIDNQSCDKMILLSKQIKDTVYLRLLLKENWTKSEMQTLLIEMFAYDAAIAIRPLKL